MTTMNGRAPHFMLGFNPNTSLDKLKIPSKFAKHLEGKASGTVSLMGPSGNTWHADLTQEIDGLFISDGWAAFVRDHFLENGDSLVFRYDGDLHFTVQMFDQSSCEKETAFSAECHQDLSIFNQHFGKKREREYASLLNNLVDGVPKRMRSTQVQSECISKFQEGSNVAEVQLGLQETMNARCEVADFLSGAEFCGSPLKNSITFALPITEVSPNEDELDRLPASEADKIAQSFTSNYPHFTRAMKRFNISGSYTLNVPYQFAMAYLPNCKVKIVLHNINGQTWTVNSIPTTRVQTSHTFCGGWLSFVRGNIINVGDICIFELVGKCEFRVHILRVRQEAQDFESDDVTVLTNGASRKVSGKLTKKVKGKSRKAPKPTKIEGQKVAFSIEKVKLGIAAKGSALGSQSRISDGKSVIWKPKGLQDRKGSPMLGCMSMKPAPEEKLAAEAFVSSFPHFVRVMKKFNISGSYTLKIPYQFSMEHLPNCRTEIVLHNLKGECWRVNSVPTLKVQMLHTLCGGWMAFVRENGIQMGDICIFELIGKCEMRVHISRVGKNAQDCQTGNPPTDELVNLSN